MRLLKHFKQFFSATSSESDRIEQLEDKVVKLESALTTMMQRMLQINITQGIAQSIKKKKPKVIRVANPAQLKRAKFSKTIDLIKPSKNPTIH